MTLEQFIANEKERLSKFEKMWKDQAAIEPESYPLEMNHGDWDEQFTIFDDTETSP